MCRPRGFYSETVVTTLDTGRWLKVAGTLRRDGPLPWIEATSIGEATAGDNIGVLFTGIEKNRLDRGSVLTAAGELPPIQDTTVIV